MTEWKELTKMTQGAAIKVERVRVVETGVLIEGTFSLPPLAQLSMEDQVFVSAFVKSHGSIKEMERLFGISYPTVKNRINKISEQLGFGVEEHATSNARMDVLERLERGEITAEEASEARLK